MRDEEKIRQQIDRLSSELGELQQAYYISGTSPASDSEYDLKFDTLLRLEGEYPQYRREDSPTLRVGSDLSSDLPEVAHTIPVLSLDKAYSPEEVLSWMERLKGRTDEPVSFVLEEKIDGISIVLYYEQGLLARAVTRGNGAVGNDVTANVRTIRSIPLRLPEPLDIAVRGEIYLPKAAFEQLNKDQETAYANPRNLAAGTIRRIRSSEVAKVPLDAFMYEGFFSEVRTHLELLDKLKALGFRLNPHTTLCSSEKELRERITERTAERDALDYEIDGLVIKVNELPLREELGYTEHHPRWATAFKFEAPTSATVVESIDVQIGRTGRVTPVARVRPVLVGGSTVSNVTLHNQDYIDMLELAIGDSVAVSKRGDVIPAVEEVLEKNSEGNGIWKLPGTCPSCGTALVREGAHHFCPNLECPDQVYGRLVFFVGRDQMDIEGLGRETITTLISLGMVKDIPDIYQVDYDRLKGEPGFGEKKVAQIRESIEKSREREYAVVLRSLGVPDLGKRMAELLIDAGISSMDLLLELVDAGESEPFTAIKGIGLKIAESLIREFSDPGLRERVSRLREAGLTFEAVVKEQPAEGLMVFAGQVWCVTGSFDQFKPRSLAEELIKELGGRVVSSVTGKTTHLLAGTGAGSKLSKAEKLGVEIVEEAEFILLSGR